MATNNIILRLRDILFLYYLLSNDDVTSLFVTADTAGGTARSLQKDQVTCSLRARDHQDTPPFWCHARWRKFKRKFYGYIVGQIKRFNDGIEACTYILRIFPVRASENSKSNLQVKFIELNCFSKLRKTCCCFRLKKCDYTVTKFCSNCHR